MEKELYTFSNKNPCTRWIKLAFVAGVSEYNDEKIQNLKGPVNDANGIVKVLRDDNNFLIKKEWISINGDLKLRFNNFCIERYVHLTGEVDGLFKEGIKPKDIRILTIFYFSGHGIFQSEDQFLLPKAFKWDYVTNINNVCKKGSKIEMNAFFNAYKDLFKKNSLSKNHILNQLYEYQKTFVGEDSRKNEIDSKFIIIMDCCRKKVKLGNITITAKNIGDVSPNHLLAYSTQLNKKAEANTYSHDMSQYTRSLIDKLKSEKGVEVCQLFNSIRNSMNNQVPEIASSFKGPALFWPPLNDELMNNVDSTKFEVSIKQTCSMMVEFVKHCSVVMMHNNTSDTSDTMTFKCIRNVIINKKKLKFKFNIICVKTGSIIILIFVKKESELNKKEIIEWLTCSGLERFDNIKIDIFNFFDSKTKSFNNNSFKMYLKHFNGCLLFISVHAEEKVLNQLVEKISSNAIIKMSEDVEIYIVHYLCSSDKLLILIHPRKGVVERELLKEWLNIENDNFEVFPLETLLKKFEANENVDRKDMKTVISPLRSISAILKRMLERRASNKRALTGAQEERKSNESPNNTNDKNVDIYRYYSSRRGDGAGTHSGGGGSGILLKDRSKSKASTGNGTGSQQRKYSKIEQDIIHEVNTNIVTNIISILFGSKCGNCCEKYFLNVASKILRLDEKEHIVQKVQRLLFLIFQFTVVVILCFFALGQLATYGADLEFLIEKENVTANGTKTYFVEYPVGKLTFYHMIILCIISIVLLACNLMMPAWEIIWGLAHSGLTLECVTFLLIVQKSSIFFAGQHLLASLVLFFVFFCFSNGWIKTISTIIYVIDIVFLFFHDLYYHEQVLDLILTIMPANIERQIVYAYFGTYVPIIILLLFHTIRNWSEVKWLQKLSQSQRKAIEKVILIGDDLDQLVADKLAEADSDIAHLKINKSLFEIDHNSLKIIKKLGEGESYSMVYLAKWKNIFVAYKIFRLFEYLGQKKYDCFEKEVNILSSLSHGYIVRFYGASLLSPRVGIVMEFCGRGDLRVFLRIFRKENDGIMYPITEKIRMLKEITSAVEYIHSRGIIHRDLKSENILVTDTFETRLTDFGVSRFENGFDRFKTKRVGSRMFMAPEVVRGDQYSKMCDSFSFAMMTYCIITENYFPFGKSCGTNIEFRIANDEHFRPKTPEKIWKDFPWLLKVVKSCWKHKEDQRPDFQELSNTFDKEQDLLSKKKSIQKSLTEKEMED